MSGTVESFFFTKSKDSLQSKFSPPTANLISVRGQRSTGDLLSL